MASTQSLWTDPIAIKRHITRVTNVFMLELTGVDHLWRKQQILFNTQAMEKTVKLCTWPTVTFDAKILKDLRNEKEPIFNKYYLDCLSKTGIKITVERSCEEVIASVEKYRELGEPVPLKDCSAIYSITMKRSVEMENKIMKNKKNMESKRKLAASKRALKKGKQEVKKLKTTPKKTVSFVKETKSGK
jgi:hypothetical protein